MTNSSSIASQQAQADLAFLDELSRIALKDFIERVFQTVSPGDEYIDNWHIDAIAWQLMQVQSGLKNRLIINQPPRSMKSICASVAFPAWVLGHNPSARIICISYSNELAAKFHAEFRQVLESSWYARVFPGTKVKRSTAGEVQTTKGGSRIATSMDGTLTGLGGDYIILDDPMKPGDAMTPSGRKKAIDKFANTISSRLNDKRTGAFILVMQRLHEDDLAGHLMKSGKWSSLVLPAIASETINIETSPDTVYQWREREALQKIREPVEELERLRQTMSDFNYSAQYLQKPVPIEGNLVRAEWLKNYEALPERKGVDSIVQSWDVAAATGEHNDWSVCTTWLLQRWQGEVTYYLMDTWRGRLAYPEMRDKLIDLAKEFKATEILVEDAGHGRAVLDELKSNKPAGMPRPQGVKPIGSKEERLSAASAEFRNGQVLFPQEAPWLADLQHELLGFPATTHDDQVDSISQFIGWARKNQSWSDRDMDGGATVLGIQFV